WEEWIQTIVAYASGLHDGGRNCAKSGQKSQAHRILDEAVRIVSPQEWLQRSSLVDRFLARKGMLTANQNHARTTCENCLGQSGLGSGLLPGLRHWRWFTYAQNSLYSSVFGREGLPDNIRISSR